ncbi:site-specific integrase [Gulosibacter hominis]|uniref:site-specific integrase n=1 Tax=Gulosibacter hominis TaxID=2770504 RepID=UPI0019191C59|nr:tyrosine-type recombinase/integrase [Gulosibacter hominis]
MARGNRRGAIERRGKRWRARYYAPDGTRPSQTFDRKGTAEAWLSSELGKIEAGTWKPAKVIQAEKFGEYAAACIDTRRTSKGAALALRTRLEYERYLRTGLLSFADVSLSEITPALVRKWHKDRVTEITQDRRDQAEERGLEPEDATYTGETMAAREARLLRMVLNTAVEDGLIDTNPVPREFTKSKTGVKHRIPTVDELARIVHFLPDMWKTPVLMAAFGGLRIGEWKALRRRDLTLREHPGTGQQFFTVNVTRQAQHIPGSGWLVCPPKSEEGIREVALPSHVTAQVRAHLERFVTPSPESLLVPPAKGQGFIHDSTFRTYWNKAKALAGVPGEVRGHDLRGFAATMFAQQGGTLRETQAFLGHGSVDAAMAYQAITGRGAELSNRIPALPAFEPSNVIQLRKEG